MKLVPFLLREVISSLNLLLFQAGGQTNPVTGSHYGFKTLKANFSYKKMAHNPTRTIEINISNGLLGSEIKNW